MQPSDTLPKGAHMWARHRRENIKIRLNKFLVLGVWHMVGMFKMTIFFVASGVDIQADRKGLRAENT